jgi:putative RNA 2'-phosphotransferase
MNDIMKLDKSQIRVSKTMSYALRHNPEKFGLKMMNRQYVHLSSDIRTALAVGKRHDDAPVLLEVDASIMHADGFKFYHSVNDGTWLCSSVPPKYLYMTGSK